MMTGTDGPIEPFRRQDEGNNAMADQLNEWKELAAQLRVDSIRCTTAAGSGHPTSSMSAADLMAVLLAKYLRYDWAAPHFPNNDRLIFSKRPSNFDGLIFGHR